MVAKRALVVDDSRSARAFLQKVLEEQQIEVDAAETAEQAIDYLLQNRPDVIFMDHLMPGMDGFQAVQAIKANPRTSAIPILMYTSQEGELYEGQALALGAAGVVQKNMAPGDVRALLQKLALLPGSAVAMENADAAPVPPVDAAEMRTMQVHVVPEPGIGMQVKDEIAALRSELAAALQAQGAQIMTEVRALARASAPAPAASLPLFPEKPRQSPWAWLLALVASVAAAVLGTLWWQQQKLLDAARNELMDSRSTLALLTARLTPASPVDGVVLNVPFGEAPLQGPRLDALRDFVSRIATLDQAGSIVVTTFGGRFCAAGSQAAGYVLADAAVPAGQCALVAGPVNAGVPQSVPLVLSTALEAMRLQHPMLMIEVIESSENAPGLAYPEGQGGARRGTAGEWNAVAAANNRVEIRWHPDP